MCRGGTTRSDAGLHFFGLRRNLKRQHGRQQGSDKARKYKRHSNDIRAEGGVTLSLREVRSFTDSYVGW